jgi:hypothetical protein
MGRRTSSCPSRETAATLGVAPAAIIRGATAGQVSRACVRQQRKCAFVTAAERTWPHRDREVQGVVAGWARFGSP